MFDYAKSQATALKLLTKFGTDCTVTKQTAGGYNPATGSSTITSTNYTVKGVLLNYNSVERSENLSAGTLVEESDKKVILQQFASVPDLNDLIVFDGVTYRIVNVKTLSPAGIDIIHECRVRT